MRLAGWAIVGSLLINLAFGAIVAGVYGVTRPMIASALAFAHHHPPAGSQRPVMGTHLAAVRMGWTIG